MTNQRKLLLRLKKIRILEKYLPIKKYERKPTFYLPLSGGAERKPKFYLPLSGGAECPENPKLEKIILLKK